MFHIFALHHGNFTPSTSNSTSAFLTILAHCPYKPLQCWTKPLKSELANEFQDFKGTLEF